MHVTLDCVFYDEKTLFALFFLSYKTNPYPTPHPHPLQLDTQLHFILKMDKEKILLYTEDVKYYIFCLRVLWNKIFSDKTILDARILDF